MSGHGVSSRSSHSAAAGRTTFAANPCTQSRTSRWSSLSSSENAPWLECFRDCFHAAEPMEVVVKPLWPSEPPRGVGYGSLLRVERGIARRAMMIEGELHLAEAAWQGDRVHLRGSHERAVERLRFMLALDDDLAPFHRAHRGDPLLGRIMRGQPKLRVLRVPDPFEALAWGVMFQLIDVQRAGQIAWAFTRAHGFQHESGLWAAPPAGRVRERRRARGVRARADSRRGR